MGLVGQHVGRISGIVTFVGWLGTASLAPSRLTKAVAELTGREGVGACCFGTVSLTPSRSTHLVAELTGRTCVRGGVGGDSNVGRLAEIARLVGWREK